MPAAILVCASVLAAHMCGCIIISFTKNSIQLLEVPAEVGQAGPAAAAVLLHSSVAFKCVQLLYGCMAIGSTKSSDQLLKVQQRSLKSSPPPVLCVRRWWMW
jgi:hypothetical protein